MADTTHAASPDDISRRNFLNLAINGVGAAMTAVLAVPLTGYFLDPALRSAESKKNWVKIGGAGDISDTPKQFTFQTERVEGFMRQQVNATAYVFKDEKGEPYALSNTCTHLGCPASWDGANSRFFCPCHGGQYDKTGKNVAGPPPRPLAQFSAKIENGDLYISV